MDLDQRINKLCFELELALRPYGVTTTAHYEKPIRQLFRRHFEEANQDALDHVRGSRDAQRAG